MESLLDQDEESPLYGTFEGSTASVSHQSCAHRAFVVFLQISFLLLLLSLFVVHLFIPFALIYDSFNHDACWNEFFVYSELTWLSTAMAAILTMLALARDDILLERGESEQRCQVALCLPGTPFLTVALSFIVGGVRLLWDAQSSPCAQGTEDTPVDQVCAQACPLIFAGISTYVTSLSSFLLVLIALVLWAPPFYVWLPALLDGRCWRSERWGWETVKLVLENGTTRRAYCNGQPSDAIATDQCCICMEALEYDVEDDEESPIVRTSRCRHLFHAACLDQWVHHRRRMPTCPLCRHELRL